ncbi:hypothetical protein [Rhizobium mayense]|uniref:Uncharacterized protein n=1 Tax=Rhizobium mayense TaxID=1312184 RepID=A0ABT7JZU2_9HYPH|nr:hypothetical protein [Rhizobium mayense]MDL2401283.1 hypothetical protein [Rhizobium mayense]
MTAALKLSEGLSTLMQRCHAFAEVADNEVITVTATEARHLFKVFELMHSLSIDMEIELACFRDMEAGREIRRATEAAATDSLSELLDDGGGKIIRPNFGNKPQ